MKKILILILVSAFALTACGPQAEPTLNPADVQATAVAAAMTMVAETQAAVPPTPTTAPPTQTPLPTLTPTTVVFLSTPTIDNAIPPTNTPVPASNNTCNQPLTKWEGESAKLYIRNNTKPKGLVTISLFFTTDLGECGYIGAQFDNVVTLTVPTGSFSAGAFVDGKKDFKVFGGGRITSGNWSLWVENESILLKAGCAPNC